MVSTFIGCSRVVPDTEVVDMGTFRCILLLMNLKQRTQVHAWNIQRRGDMDRGEGEIGEAW